MSLKLLRIWDRSPRDYFPHAIYSIYTFPYNIYMPVSRSVWVSRVLADGVRVANSVLAGASEGRWKSDP